MKLKDYFDLSLPSNNFPSFSNIRELVDYAYTHYADRIFVIDKGVEYTYKQVYKKIKAISKIMAIENTATKQIMTAFASDGLEYIIVALAAMSCNFGFLALPSSLNKEALEGLVRGYQIKTIFYDDDTKEKLLQENKFALMDMQTHLFSIQLSSMELPKSITKTDLEPFWQTDISPNDLATVLFTTGTDGQSKGVMLSHKNLLTGMRNGLLGFKEAGYDEDGQRYQLTIPMTHSFGLIRNLLCAMATGSTIIISQNNKAIIEDIQKYNPTRLITVPGICDILLQLHKMGVPHPFGTALEYIVIGGAALTTQTINELQKLNIPVYNGYGMTETSNLFSGNPYEWDKQSAIGVPYPNSEYKIVDQELLVKGDNVFQGYYKQNNDQTFDNEGYYHTGDLVEEDDNGLLHFIGRKKQLIVLSSGINISPSYIENIFVNNIDFIKECYVYSPDNKILVCEYYAAVQPENLDKVYYLNNTLGEQKITTFKYRNTPFEKTSKLEIKR